MDYFLVEDAPMLRVRLEALLNALPGARMVGFAETADEAIEAIVARRPDVVILDMHLKQGTGLDVLRSLQGRMNGTDVYVLTNHALDAYRQTTRKLGARGFFDKSRDLDALREALAARGR